MIIATTAFGKTAGVGAALLASALMLFIDYRIFLHWPADVFQASLIVSSVAVILAWLVGGLMEVERKTQQDLLELADYDQLTGLYNHRYLQEKIALSLQKSVKSGTPYPWSCSISTSSNIIIPAMAIRREINCWQPSGLYWQSLYRNPPMRRGMAAMNLCWSFQVKIKQSCTLKWTTSKS